MQRVLKNIFLIDDKTENNLKFWVLLGPYLLLLSIILSSFNLSLFTSVLLFLCYRFKFKGLLVSLTTLIIYSFYVQVNLEEEHLWNLGLQLSIALGLIISTCGFEEIRNLISINEDVKNEDLSLLQKQLKEKEQQFETTRKNLEENLIILKGELNKKAQKILQVSTENENLKKDLEDNIHRKDYLLNELDNKVKEIEQLTIKQDELFEKISFLKDEEFLHEKNKNLQKEIDDLKILNEQYKNVKNTISNELIEETKKIDELSSNETQVNNSDTLEKRIKEKDYQIFKLKEKLKNTAIFSNENVSNDEILKEYKNRLQELSNINSLYSQLKKQFEEKKQILNKTRQELFQAKEKLSSFQIKQNDFENLNENERSILNELDEAIDELQKYKSENKNLEEIVSLLINKENLFDNK